MCHRIAQRSREDRRPTDLGPPTVRSSTASATVTTIPVSGWMSAAHFAKGPGTVEMRSRMGSTDVAFGHPTADATSGLDRAIGVDAHITADGAGPLARGTATRFGPPPCHPPLA